MPNARYLNDAVAQAALDLLRPEGHKDTRGAFEVWASRLTDAQLRGAFGVLVEELARRKAKDPDQLRALLEVTRSVG